MRLTVRHYCPREYGGWTRDTKTSCRQEQALWCLSALRRLTATCGAAYRCNRLSCGLRGCLFDIHFARGHAKDQLLLRLYESFQLPVPEHDGWILHLRGRPSGTTNTYRDQPHHHTIARAPSNRLFTEHQITWTILDADRIPQIQTETIPRTMRDFEGFIRNHRCKQLPREDKLFSVCEFYYSFATNLSALIISSCPATENMGVATDHFCPYLPIIF
jgi:hypothetical protein